MAGDPVFELNIDAGTSTVQLKLVGEIDLAVMETLGEAVDTSLAGRPDSVVVDFSGVTFMDSTGIRFLISFKNRCDAIGALWSLVNTSPSIDRLIDLSGLTDFLRSADQTEPPRH